MKKALYVDKAPATVKMLLQVQNLNDSAMMKSSFKAMRTTWREYRYPIVAGATTKASNATRLPWK
eukprot:8705254-Pyramimonas_sp.AAC.1